MAGGPQHINSNQSVGTMGTDYNGQNQIRKRNGMIGERTKEDYCGCHYDPKAERLEYDYTYDDTAHGKKPQPLPRIRQRGEYYIDSYNGDSWSCSFGTNEEVRSVSSFFKNPFNVFLLIHFLIF